MRLLNFRIKKYRSIDDTGIVKLSELDNVSVFAGQNESGKSSILKALYDFERGKFEADSTPFSIDERPVQVVSCTYKINNNENLADILTDIVKDEYSLQIEESEKVLDESILNSIKEFTITRTKDSDKIRTSIDEKTFQMFCASISDRLAQPVEGEVPKEKEKYFVVADSENGKVSEFFWQITPRIIFFDDFCDLLPDKILLSVLKDQKTDAKGYRAVKNLEKILNTDFTAKDNEIDPVRGTKQSKENDSLSVDFQTDWGQRIHGENKVVVKYDFQKRNGDGDNGSYVNFYVETKEGQPLPPKQRSKGLVWFLSLWLELKAQDIDCNDLVLLLDEPDQHLHVKAQNDILKLINKLASNKGKKRGDQIIYATHSPYLIEIENLSRIKLILNTAEQGTKIEDIVTSKIDTEYKKDALQPIADAIGLNVSEFSTLNKKNVILEGISDFYYFSAMKKILGKKGDYHFLPGISVRQINNLISLCVGYGLEWIAIIDDDPDNGGKDSKKKFDEIKDFMFDGDEHKTKDRVHILPGILGIENMFTIEDLKLVDTNVTKNPDNAKAVGERRKVLFSKSFYEKVYSTDKGINITATKLSDYALKNFAKAFDFIDKNFTLSA